MDSDSDYEYTNDQQDTEIDTMDVDNHYSELERVCSHSFLLDDLKSGDLYHFVDATRRGKNTLLQSPPPPLVFYTEYNDLLFQIDSITLKYFQTIYRVPIGIDFKKIWHAFCYSKTPK